jgi:hypothetical protein
MQAETAISEWLFNLSQPVYLIHPNFKFWEASQSAKTLTFRAGKLANQAEDKIETTSKTYLSKSTATATLITKI